MYNRIKYFANGRDWNSFIIIKTEEEMELFEHYINSCSRLAFEEPVYALTDPDRNGWIKAYSNYDLDTLRSKYAQLRKKRGSFHKWTVEDISKSEKRLKRLLDDVDYDKIDKTDIKYVCHHIDKLSNYIEDLVKRQNEG